MDNNKQNSLLRALIFILIVASAAGLIIFLKRSSDVPLTPEGIAHRDSVSHIAHPDTTTLPDEQNSEIPSAASPQQEENDSISTDLRSPSDAGYEDGYNAGLTDGINQDERASYDESSQFPTTTQRRTYAEGYRRGYEAGFTDGMNGGETHPTPLLPNDGTENPLLQEEEHK